LLTFFFACQPFRFLPPVKSFGFIFAFPHALLLLHVQEYPEPLRLAQTQPKIKLIFCRLRFLG
jgi:hypothetical protein